MKSLCLITASSLMLMLAACSQAADAPAVSADAEPAPVPTGEVQTDAAAAPAFELDEGSKALLATMSPKELGMARLSCVRPINSAKPTRRVFDDAMTAELASIDYMSQTGIITSIEGMTIAQARAVMDASPEFNNASTPTAEELAGLKQCIVLARHYAAEQAAQKAAH